MDAAPTAPALSPLQEANRRLHELRKKYQADCNSGRWSVASGQWSVVSDQQSVDSAQRSMGREQTPAPGGPQSTKSALELSPLTIHNCPFTIHNSSVPVYPDIALGMLQQEQAAAGRIWLLLRFIDKEGRGWLPLEQIREQLTTAKSPLRVCGWRQLRNLMQQGRGVFWERDKQRIWLKSVAKVATALGVDRLTGRPVSLPVEILLGGVGQVRAHFYASFHSGRRSNNPISRSKLEQITHVPERTQRVYEQKASVTVQPNFAVGARYSTEQAQERSWQHGRATFEFIDHHGKQGPAGGRYVAWRLPNSYEGNHESCPRGRQKKINHQIDLVNLGAQGNDLHEQRNGLLDESSISRPRHRLYHQSGQDAGKAYNRDGTVDAYWPPGRGWSRTCPAGLWQVIPAQAEEICRY